PAGEELDEAAKFLDGDNLATIDLADLGLGGHAFDGVAGDLHTLLGDGVDVDCAVVLDVDFAAGFLDEAFDVFAAGADEGANLLRINAQLNDARGVLAHFLAGLGDGGGHGLEDVEAGNARFFEGFGHDAVRESAEFEVQLKAGDAFLGAGGFAVHVAEGVFPTDDVCHQFVGGDFVFVVMLGANADADAGDGAGHGHARVEQGEGAAANAGHGSRAVGFHDFAGDTHGVRIGVEREHGLDGALRKGAVAYFAAPGAADATGFADGIIGEVVVQDEFLLRVTAGVGIELLGVLGGAEGDEGQGLGFAA